MSLPYAYTPYIWPVLVTAALLLMLGVYAWRRRTVPAAFPFLLLVLTWVLWALGSALELAAVEPQIKWFWFQFEAAWKVPTITFGLVFVLAYAGLDKWLTRTTLTLLAFPCLLIPVLIVTNPLHNLGWTAVSIGQDVVPANGPIIWATVLYVSLLFLVQIGVLVWLWFRAPLYRWPVALMIGTQMLARAGSFADTGGVNPFAPLDAGLLFSIPIILVYFLALFHFRFFDVVPVGRETAIERMANGVLILNAENRIVDMNPAAEQVLSLARGAVIGRPAGQVLAVHPELMKLLEQATPGSAEISLGQAGQTNCYLVQVSPLTHPRGFKLGLLILLQDVTEQKRARALLEEQQQTHAILQERERLARELHDGLGQMLAAAHLHASTARQFLAQGANAQTDECLDQLAAMTLEAQADVREYLLGAKTVSSGEHPFFPSLRQYLKRYSQHYGLRVELTVPPDVEARGLPPAVDVQLLRVIQEALSNVRKHARAQCAHVSLTMQGPQVRIVIADDGRGFDPAAVAAQSEGYGLNAMRERAQGLGGRVEIDSKPGSGTRVLVEVPCENTAG